MGDLAVSFRRSLMDMGSNNNYNKSSSRMNKSSSISAKTERKVIEKNRRNQMKTLFSDLNSLLPKQSSKEALPLPDQIDEAINYIKSLQAKLKNAEEKKENLTGKKRSFSSSCYESSSSSSSTRAPQLQIREMGSALQIVLICGLDNRFIFYEIIRILHEEDADIVSASFSVSANSIYHVIHVQMREIDYSFRAVKVSERLNRFINGPTREIELEPELWDFHGIHPETWTF